MKKILVVEPFMTGSHEQWVKGLQKNIAGFDVDVISLEGRFWKWRMHGGAVTLAEKMNGLKKCYDLVIVSDMLDLALFRSRVKVSSSAVFAVYFHENQLTYPWSPGDPDVDLHRDGHYAFINYSSALCADFCYFNSDYHRISFIDELRLFLNAFPDYNNPDTVDEIERKSATLHLAADLKKLNSGAGCRKRESGVLNILWNHRWEYDKGPETFHKFLVEIRRRSVDFRLILTGEKFRKNPDVLDRIRNEFGSAVIYDGYAESSDEYAELLGKSDLLPVTNIQDFFGLSVLEAVSCGVIPLLPDRLAYPEIYGTAENSLFFYSSFCEMVDSAVDISMNPDKYNTDMLQKRAMEFDWSNMRSFYEGEFSRIISV